MTKISTVRKVSSTSDSWDDDALWDDKDNSGPSWYKSYVGGVKHREYEFPIHQS